MKTMLVCNYSVVRFLPYPETQEFVNLGVALACPATRMFEFKVETRRRERVTGFFPELARGIFEQGRRDFGNELRRLKKILNAGHNPNQVELPLDQHEFLRLFQEIVRPRESVFRFGSIGTVLTEDPQQELQRLFADHVERQFAQHEDYQENVMVRRLATTFRAKDILDYKPERLGNDIYHVALPFVRHLGDGQTAVRAIKPLDLAKSEPTRIIEHGDRWAARIRHLQKMDYDPAAFLFPVKMPGDAKKVKAAEQICDVLRDTGVRIIPFRETERIVEFAASA